MMRTKTPERESRNPHALLEFLARYLVMPRPQKAKGKRQGGLEQQLGQEKPRPSSVLEEIQQSIDSIISGSPFQEELSITHPEDPQFDAKVKVLNENVAHHIMEEERELLPLAEKKMKKEEMNEIGEELKAFKLENIGEEN